MLERIFINLGFSFIICFLEHGKSCLLYNQAFAYLLFFEHADESQSGTIITDSSN